MSPSIDAGLQSQAQLIQLENEGYDAGLLEGLRDRVANVMAIIDNFRKKVGALMKNPDFTAKGKEARVAELKRTTNETLFTELQRARCYQDQIDSLEKQRRPIDAPAGDPVVRELRAREVRDRLHGKDPLELRVLYEEAVAENKDPEMQVALEDAPIALLPADVVARGKQMRAMRADPATASKINNLRVAQRVLQDTIAAAQAELELPKDDFVSRIARGEAA